MNLVEEDSVVCSAEFGTEMIELHYRIALEHRNELGNVGQRFVLRRVIFHMTKCSCFVLWLSICFMFCFVQQNRLLCFGLLLLNVDVPIGWAAEYRDPSSSSISETVPWLVSPPPAAVAVGWQKLCCFVRENMEKIYIFMSRAFPEQPKLQMNTSDMTQNDQDGKVSMSLLRRHGPKASEAISVVNYSLPHYFPLFFPSVPCSFSIWLSEPGNWLWLDWWEERHTRPSVNQLVKDESFPSTFFFECETAKSMRIVLTWSINSKN